jgi:hypothetical protein
MRQLLRLRAFKVKLPPKITYKHVSRKRHKHARTSLHCSSVRVYTHTLRAALPILHARTHAHPTRLYVLGAGASLGCCCLESGLERAQSSNFRLSSNRRRESCSESEKELKAYKRINKHTTGTQTQNANTFPLRICTMGY